MTDIPAWVRQTPNLSSLHTMPAGNNPLQQPFSWEELERISEFFKDAFVAQIAIAFGGIEIFGWKPFEFLVDWGNDLLAQATAAYLGQEAANNKIGGIADLFDIADPDDLTGALDLAAIWKNLMEAVVPPDTVFSGGSVQGNDIISSLVNSLKGWIGDWSLADANQSLVDAAETLAQNSAAIEALRARLEQNSNSGVFVLVDFSQYSNSTQLPSSIFPSPSYSGPGSGTYGVNNGRAKVTAAGTAARSVTALYNPSTGVKNTLTDDQVVVGVWTGAPRNDGFGNRGYAYLEGRKSSSGTSRVYAKLGDDSAELGCVVSGTPTTFAIVGNGGSGTFKFKANTAYYLLCGLGGVARTFQIRESRFDSPPILSYTDTGATSSLGASFRGVGVRADWYASVFGSVLPGEQLYFGFADNTLTSSVVGSTFRAVRTSTATTNADAGSNLYGNTWYTTTERLSADYTYTPGSANELTVNADGTYYVTISQRITSGLASTLVWKNVLYHNGSVVRRGNSMTYPAFVGNEMIVQTTLEVYCLAGDTLQPGYWCSSNPLFALTAEASGGETYWAVTRNKQLSDAT